MSVSQKNCYYRLIAIKNLNSLILKASILLEQNVRSNPSISNGLRFNYGMSDFGIVRRLYFCNSAEIDSSGWNVTSVTGTHMAGKTNNDIEGFHGYQSPNFPGNLKTFFPNLKALDW
jgi:hypothetical protein